MKKASSISFLLKKRYLLILLLVAIFGYGKYHNYKEKILFREYYLHPPLYREIWPSEFDPNGVTLDIPANYLMDATAISESSRKKDLEFREKQRYESGKALCDRFQCTELFQVLLPDYKGKTLENLHIFNPESVRAEYEIPKDWEEFYKYVIWFSLNSWIPKNHKVNASDAEITMGINLSSVFHPKEYFETPKLIKYIQTKPAPELGLTEVVSLDPNLLGGFYKVLVYKDWRKKYPEDVIEDYNHYKIYFKKDADGNIASYISCSTFARTYLLSKPDPEQAILEDYAKPNQQYYCSHTFNVKGLPMSITAHYSDMHLADWQNIENNLTRLIQSFHVKETK